MSKTKRHYENIWSLHPDVTDPSDNGEDGSPLTVPDKVHEEALASGLSTEALLNEITLRGFTIDWELSKAFQETLVQLAEMNKTLKRMAKRLK